MRCSMLVGSLILMLMSLQGTRAQPPAVPTGLSSAAAGSLSPLGQTRKLQVLKSPRNHGGIFCFAWSPDGLQVAGGTGVIFSTNDRKIFGGGEVVLWDAATGELARTLGTHGATVKWVAFSRDGKRLVSLGVGLDDDKATLKVWDMPTGKQLSHHDLPQPLYASPALTPDGKTLVWIAAKITKVQGSGGNPSKLEEQGALHVWDLDSGQERWSLADPGLRSDTLAIHGAGKVLATSARKVSDNKEQREVRVYLLGSGQLLRAIPLGPYEYAEQLAFLPDGKHLAGLGRTDCAIWDATSGTLAARIPLTLPNGVSLRNPVFSPDGSTLMTVDFMRGNLRQWELRSGTSQGEVLYEALGGLWHAAISSDLTKVACQQDFASVVLAIERQRRTWRDATGKFTVEAELVEVKDGKAFLKKADGRVGEIPTARLSEADQNYLKSLDPESAVVKRIRNLGGEIGHDRGLARGPVTRVKFRYDSKLTDADLQPLKGLTQLQELALSRTAVTDAGLEHLQGVPKLQRLDLAGTKITDAGLKRLSALPQLRELELANTPITDAGLGHLKALSQLEKLSLDYTQVTDAGLKHVQGLPQLRVLGLSETQVTDAGLQQLAGLNQLRQLSLGSKACTGSGLKHLQGLPSLQSLSLSGAAATDAGLEQVQAFPKLKELILIGGNVTDAGLGRIKGLTQLQMLMLSGSAVTDAGLQHLKGLTELQHLGLSAASLTDAGLEHLQGLSQLQTLNLDQTKVTDAGLKHLIRLTKLNFLSLGQTQVSSAGVAELRKSLPKAMIMASGKR